MQILQTKTKIMVFKNGSRRDSSTFYYNSSAIEIISFTYWGVNITDNDRF